MARPQHLEAARTRAAHEHAEDLHLGGERHAVPSGASVGGMETCSQCGTPFAGRDLCPKDGTLRRPGVVVGDRYALDRLIGAGGMGIVYAGRHQLLGKGVAVKILRGDLVSDAAQVSRFLREAQLCSQLRHESIIDITDFGRDAATGNLYLVMELLIGTSLAEVLAEEGTLSLERALPILRQVCSALSAAHQAGVAHRDLNPRNIFLTDQSGRKDVVKLLDFGISRLVGGEDRVTGTGVPIGTTPYMPPEQLRGATQDHRVDIYAFGVLAYELLTGTHPWKQRSPVLLIAEKLSGELPDLSQSQLAQTNPGLAQLVTECLSSDPERRPASAAELEQRILGSGAMDLRQAENLSGMRAGSYRLARLLGSGGLGSVWLGEHPVIGSRVAIKVLHPQVSESMEVVRRFITEAQAVNRMESPHIVKIFDFGKLSDGRDYAAMELLEGETLGARLARSGPMPWEQVRQIAVQMVSALEAAHRAGVVHRDLKPDNVFLTGPEQTPLCKVLDFGIAKLVSGEGTSVHQTRLGLVMGTPLYAAPEQVEGHAIGPAADIYALGSVIFEMLSGQPPFIGPLQQMLTAKVIGDAPSLAERVPGLDSRVTALVQAMLARAPEDRPALVRVNELLEGGHVGGTQGAAPRRPTPGAPTVQWTPRPSVPSPGLDGAAGRGSPGLDGAAGRGSPGPTAGSIPELPTIISAATTPVAAVGERPAPRPVDSGPTDGSVLPDHQLLHGLELEPEGEPPHSPARLSRRSLALAGGTLLLLAVGVGAVLWLRTAPPPRPPRSVALSSTLAVKPGGESAPARALPASRPAEPAERSERADRKQADRKQPATLVLVQSTPPGAKVLLRGKSVGTTPVSLRLDPRLPEVEVELQKRGYRRTRRVLRAGQRAPLAVSLEPLAPGKTTWSDPFSDAAIRGTEAKRQHSSGPRRIAPRAAGKKPVLANPFED